MSQPLLRIEGLRVEYRTLEGTVHAVNGLDLAVDEKRAVGLVGETGAGKTTTALCVMGLLPRPPGRVVAGRILYRGKDLLAMSERDLRTVRGRHISMIFQNPMSSLNPVHPVGQQVAEVIREHERVTAREATEAALAILRAVGIPETRFWDYPHEFSGGMRQRVMIAMALICKPGLLIADEPTTALDVTIQAQVIDLMAQLKREMNGSLVLITHDLGLVAELCEEVAIMYAGKVVEFGPIEAVFSSPAHPYTVGLFGSIPRLDKTVRRLTPIRGLSPDPKDLPRGCAFHPRCPDAKALCARTEPPAVVLEGGHSVSCWKWSEVEADERIAG